jgi:hypothetical protein
MVEHEKSCALGHEVSVPDIRIRALNEAPVAAEGKYVLYWMIAYRRTTWNFSLQRAVEPEYEPSIAAIADGPLWVRGAIKVQAADGFAYEQRNRITLCRCGQSENKPFCDGSHKEAGFRAP